MGNLPDRLFRCRGPQIPPTCPIMTHAELLTFAWVQMSRGSGDTIQLRVGVDPNMPPLWSATNPLSFHAAGGISLCGVRIATKNRPRNRTREPGQTGRASCGESGGQYV